MITLYAAVENGNSHIRKQSQIDFVIIRITITAVLEREILDHIMLLSILMITAE